MLDPAERLQNMQPARLQTASARYDPIVTVAQRATPPNCKHWKHSTAAAAVAVGAAAAPLLDVDVHELAAAPDRQRAHVPARAGAVLLVPDGLEKKAPIRVLGVPRDVSA